MASIKVKFRPSTVAKQEGSVYYQIIHERRVRQLISEYKVFPEEWDECRSTVVAAPHHMSERSGIISRIRDGIRLDIERLSRIIRRLDNNSPGYTADDVVEEFNRYIRDYSLFSFMQTIATRLKANGKIRTAETYMTTLNSFRRFRQGADIMLDMLTPEQMEAYEAWLRNRGAVSNTVSFYNRILRAVYNRAVESDSIKDRHPFRHVYTGVDKTVKRALPLTFIRRIKSLDLSERPKLDFARDMFLMSFYLRGMSFVDMAFLRKSDLKNGYITYRRRKTGQKMIIKWTKEMKTILDKYPENQSLYLLPIIRHQELNDRSVYRNMSYKINHNLKEIAEMAGVAVPLTLYVARHSWASAAKAKGIPLTVISEGMGHDSELTTRIYLASLDTAVVDKANSLIIASL